jgi:elongation of very long chain fatty acids protein 6
MAQQLGEYLLTIGTATGTEYENSFRVDAVNPFGPLKFCIENPQVPILAVIGYLVFCYFGIKYFDSRKPWGLRYTLALWNFCLATFSFIGMVRTVPHLIGMLLTKSFRDTICLPATETYGNGIVGFWVMLFIFSKLPELIDTFFIVVRKRPLIFLHWYHHVTVLLYCWHAYATMAGSGLYFVAMNYSVHAFMYAYFCLQALKMVPKGFPAYLITICQIAQMLIGTGVCVSAWYFKLHDDECSNDRNNLIAGALMYGSYLYLFVDFAVRRFILSPPAKEGDATKPKGETKKGK